MSNPLDPTIETLKTVEPHPEAIDHAVAALLRPHPPRLIPLAIGVGGISAAFLWPRPGNGMAWAQVAAQDLPLRFHERTVAIRHGKATVQFETWVDRPDDASRNRFLVPDRFPTPGTDPASVPSHLWDMIESSKGHYVLSGTLATYSQRPLPHSSWDPRDAKNVQKRTHLERLLGNDKIHQLGLDRDVATRVGKADRYRLDGPSYDDEKDPRRETGRRSFVVYVQPGTRRVLGMDSLQSYGSVWQTTIEYPDRFPADTFAFPRGERVPTFDLDALDRQVEARLRTPIATLRVGGQTAQLRLVLQGVGKELYVLWSGAKPNGDLAHYVRVLGVPNEGRYGLAAFTSKGDRGYFAPYGGHAINLDRRVDRVDLKIPVFAPGTGHSRFVGDAMVRGVPVIQVSEPMGVRAVWPKSTPPGITHFGD